MDTKVRSAEVRRHPFSVEEYHLMEKAGLFVDRPRVELLDGEVLEMASMGTRHGVCLIRIDSLLHLAVGSDAVITIQIPLRLDDLSEPEPDAAVLRAPTERYDSASPTAADALLVIEVSDTTLAFDRDVKAVRYGSAGIGECWVIDLEGAEVLVHRGPCPTGYSDLHRARRGETLAIPGLTEAGVGAGAEAGAEADAEIAVSDLLGPA
ncbi:MAG: Uma2 family endonuclease [Acidimicrobiales bacterium]